MITSTSAIVVVVMLVAHCDSANVSEFEESVGICGTAPFEDFTLRANARKGEFPWNALITIAYNYGKWESIHEFEQNT